MKKRLFRGIVALMLCIVCLMGLSQTAFAADEEITVSLPVTVLVAGNTPTPAEKFKIELTALNGAPEAQQNPITVRGGEARPFYICFDKVGVYEYTVKQEKGTNSNATYDKTEYHVKLTITYNIKGQLEVSAAIREGNQTEKAGKVVFRNNYAYRVPSNTPKTGDTANFTLYGILAGASALVLVYLFLTRKKKDQEQE